MTSLPSIAGLSALSFFLSLALTPLVRNYFLRRGLLDRPDGRRKLHAHAVPRVGGIPIVISYLVVYALLLAVPSRDGSAVFSQMPLILALLPAAAVIFATGIVDDLRGIKPWQKLSGQLAGAALALAGGVQITSIGGYALGQTLSVLVTLAWLVGCSNAFNLIDGLDGLASGMGLFSTLTIFVAAVLQNNHMLALATLPLCGSLLGFLRYNFNPASVFLGDSGSLLIGFLLGCYGVIWSHKSATLLGMTAPVMALAIPLLDVLLAILRRWLRGQPIFGGDRHHIHHKLLDRGLTHRRVVLVLYVVCGVYASLSLLQSMAENQVGGLILVLFCLVTWLGIQSLGYFEFGLASRILLGGALRRLMHGQILLHTLDRNLREAPDIESCWLHLREAVSELGFCKTEARLNGWTFHQLGESSGGASFWQVRIPLPLGDYIHLARSFDRPLQPAEVGSLVDLVHRKLPERLAKFKRRRTEAGIPDVASLISLAEEVGHSSGRPADIPVGARD